jgi:hypothetical protein
MKRETMSNVRKQAAAVGRLYEFLERISDFK